MSFGQHRCRNLPPSPFRNLLGFDPVPRRDSGQSPVTNGLLRHVEGGSRLRGGLKALQEYFVIHDLS